MKTSVKYIENILETRYLVSARADRSVSLVEPKVMRVEVSDLDANAVVIRLDKMSKKLSIAKGGPWNQLCDYMIISQSRNKTRVLLVELKHTHNGDQDFEQLRRSLPVFEYIYSMAQIEYGFLPSRYDVHYVLVAKTSKVTTKKQNVKPNASFPKMTYKNIKVTLCVGEESIRFRRLSRQ